MKWLSLPLGLSLVLGCTLLASGCTRPYASRAYGRPATRGSQYGVAADAQPHDVHAALQKYLGTN